MRVSIIMQFSSSNTLSVITGHDKYVSTLPEMLVFGFDSVIPSKFVRHCLYLELMPKWRTTVAQWAIEQNDGQKLTKVTAVDDKYRRYLALPNDVAKEFIDFHGVSAIDKLRHFGQQEIKDAIHVMDQAVHGLVNVEDGDENDVIEI